MAEEAIGSVVTCMQNHATDYDMQCVACDTLSKFTVEGRSNAKAMWDHGAATAILAALDVIVEGYSNAKAQTTRGEETSCNDEERKQEKTRRDEDGGASLTDYADVCLIGGCAAVFNMYDFDEHRRDEPNIGAVVRAMAAIPQSYTLQLNAIHCIRLCAEDVETSRVHFGTVALNAVLKSTVTHKETAELVQVGFRALAALRDGLYV
jgi:hypothetical protein